MACAAKWTAFRPLPHTLLIVKAGVVWGNPALITACRAGFWPVLAVSTWPRITSSIASGARFVFFKRSRMTIAPKSAALIPARLPLKLPTAVLAAATITTLTPMQFS